MVGVDPLSRDMSDISLEPTGLSQPLRVAERGTNVLWLNVTVAPSLGGQPSRLPLAEHP